MKPFTGRGSTACYNCHRQKVRCNGEQPCQRCRARQKECLYAVKEAIIPVPESYLQRIDNSLNELKEAVRVHGLANTSAASTGISSRRPVDEGRSAQEVDSRPGPSQASEFHKQTNADPLVDDATAESFIRKLRQVVQTGISVANVWSPQSPAAMSASQRSSGSGLSQEGHASMRFDTLYSQLNFRLPPYPYAVQLVTKAEQEFGDYHTFLRKTFWKRLHATYREPHSQSGDRNWLCRLTLVLALAEASTTSGQSLASSLEAPQTIALSGEGSASWTQEACPTLSSGIEFFEQGLVLLKVSYEDATVNDVEALNLASHCSYMLNRRRSAYGYAGQSIRLAHSLGLDKPAPPSLSNVEREHRKRVWWTAYCIDRSTSAELGLRPAFVGMAEGLDYPTSDNLTPEEQEEFYNPELLKAQVQVCDLKSYVVETVGRLKSQDIERPYEMIGNCLERLDSCGMALNPSLLSRTRVDDSASNAAEARIALSILLRYNQAYILLLRPILLHQFAYLLRNDSVITLSDDICTVNKTCLEAARRNAKIMLDLASSGRLVKYGYWDSVHLFSCLLILAIANYMGVRLPGAFRSTGQVIDDDVSTYAQGREILFGMVQAGNISSKHHLSMLEEVESIGGVMPGTGQMPSFESNTAPATSDDIEIELGFDHWADLMMAPDTQLRALDIFSAPFE